MSGATIFSNSPAPSRWTCRHQFSRIARCSGLVVRSSSSAVGRMHSYTAFSKRFTDAPPGTTAMPPQSTTPERRTPERSWPHQTFGPRASGSGGGLGGQRRRGGGRDGEQRGPPLVEQPPPPLVVLHQPGRLAEQVRRPRDELGGR